MRARPPRWRLFPGRRSARRQSRAAGESRWEAKDSRAFDRQLARANGCGALADECGIGVIVIAAQVQERIDVDVVELELRDRAFGGLAVGSFDDRIVERAALRGLEILARRKSLGAELARVKVVEDVAQRFQFVAQDIDWFERIARHTRELIAAQRADSTRGAGAGFARSVALDQTMDGAQVALRVAFAAHRFVHLGGVAMRLDVGGIAFERALKTSQRVLMLISLAREQAELQVDVGAGGNDRSRAQQMAQRATEIAFAFEQRGEAHVRFEVAGLAADQLAIDVKRLERILVGDAARFFETLAHAGRTETVLDLAALIAAGEVENQLAGLGLDQRRTIAHDDAAVVVDEFQ